MIKKIGIIGSGNMGSAFYKALVPSFLKEILYICDKDTKKLKALNATNTSKDPNELLNKVDVVILAIKPQSFDEFKKKLKVDLRDKLIISIMAGISMERIKKDLKTDNIIRSMPNLPIQVKQGVIGWTASLNVSDVDKKIARKIFSSLGEGIELKDESMLDAITLISGCGPAYFFYLTEMLTSKAEALGFSKIDAQKIAETTFTGSAELLKKDPKTAEDWKMSVASRGGVTEAALKYMSDNKLAEIFDEAIEAAEKRNLELSK